MNRNRLLSSLKQAKYRTINHRYYTSNCTANILRPKKAPGTVQGQNFDPDHLVAADLEAERLKLHHHDNRVSVTTDEVTLGIVRSLAIGSEFMAQIYPTPDAPVWFNNALNNALNAALAPIQADIATLQNSVGALQNSVGALQNSVDTIGVRLENQNIKRLNNARLACNATLTPLRKQVAGLGPGLGNHNVGVRLQLFAVGAPINVNYFPRTSAALSRLTEDNISRLSALFNDDFGIIRGDTIETQRVKFKEFMS